VTIAPSLRRREHIQTYSFLLITLRDHLLGRLFFKTEKSRRKGWKEGQHFACKA
jgi:hypothetical protein